MPSQIHGKKTQVITQVEESGVVTKTGIDGLSRVEMIPYDKFPSLLRRPGSLHPRFTNMVVSRITWQRQLKFYKVTYDYAGNLAEYPEAPVYSLQGTLSQEDIEHHPKFVQSLAGTPSEPLNGAFFVDPETNLVTKDDEKGVFREFKTVTSGEQNPKAGIDSYFAPGLVWRKTYTSKNRPTDLTNIGKIDSPEGPNPNVSPRTWLYLSCDYTEKGGVYEIQKSWLMSDRRGWDTDIYE